ncbi:hypothetical protein, partial [Actinomadura harenae]
ASCLGVWRHAPDRAPSTPGDDAWAVVALHRLAVRLGLRREPPPGDHAARLHRTLLQRLEEHRSFDLSAEPLAI